jgi:PAS domain S-box-containing protein
MRRQKIILFFSLVFLSCFYCFGQGYLVHRYSESEPDGLPSSMVHDVIQDRLGRIWFATRSGIAVYDGVSWGKYTTADDLPVPAFAKIDMDSQGRIWAVSYWSQGGAYVVHSDGQQQIQWPRLKTLKAVIRKMAHVTSFQVGGQGPQNHLPTMAVGTKNHGVFILNRGSWENITETHGLLSNSINGIVFLEETGTFYLATDNGLSAIHISNQGISVDNRLDQRLDFPAHVVKGICIEYKDKYPDCPLTHSRVWLFAYDWLGYFQEGRSTMAALYPVTFPFRVKHFGVSLLPDYRSGLYVGNQHELSYFNYKTHRWERLDTVNELISESARSLAVDFEKNIWIACDRGVSKISSRRFSNFRLVHGLLEDEVTALVEVEPGKFVLGHNRGITLYDYHKKLFRRIPFPQTRIVKSTESRVLDMQSDSKKNTWMAVSNAGLAKVTPRGKITWYGEKEGLHGYVGCLWIDNRDNVWLGTDRGIFLRTGTPAGNGFVSQKIGGFTKINPRRIYGSEGQLRYAASHQAGVYVYEDQIKQWKNYRVPGDSKANSVYAVKKDSRGRLLIGTLNGLFILENQTPVRFKIDDFQVDRPVYFILEDNKHRLWFGTDNGVIRWDGKNARRYSLNQGLIGQETNRAAAIQDSRGRIWIGTNRGVSVYDETFDNNELFNPPPKIHLLNLEIQGKNETIPLTSKENYNKPIRLGHRENTITFHFKGISFEDETAVRFKSKLEGLENRWSKERFHHEQMIRYINLSPGTYRFYIKVRNARGVWSETASSPGIIIRQPFYRAWWFFLGMVLLAGLISYGMFRFFSAKRQAALLEKEVEKRTHQLQAVEQQYRSLFEESKDVVFITDPEGKLIDVNPAGVELFGYDSKEESKGIYVSDYYINPADRKGFREEIETRGFVKDYEIMLRRRDGGQINALVTATVVRDKTGKVTAYRGMMRDITRQKTLEQRLLQAQKMEAIGTLAGGIAHDFNNILGVILGYSELLMDDLPRGSQEHQSTRQILTAAERAKELVKQILAFSRQSKGEVKPAKLNVVINEALKLLRSTLPSTIDIRQDIRVNENADWVMADVTRIHQVMMNLGANAAHAMRKDGGVMEVTLDEVVLDPGDVVGDKELKPGPCLRLTVNDTGHGISPEVMERIFDPFFTTKSPGEGTGMGLAVIHGIVKDHGGNITAYSKPGKGSSFHVYLPRLEEEAELKSTLTEEIPGGSERILLVDDESALAQVGKQILERLGYEVEGKSNSLEALEVFRNEPDRFHLIISDVTMPQMTGIQLAIEARRIRPRVPFILCSGFSTAVTREEIRSIGVNDFVMKPIIKGELARVVRRVLDERKE